LAAEAGDGALNRALFTASASGLYAGAVRAYIVFVMRMTQIHALAFKAFRSGGARTGLRVPI
jgi:hypothetical protein